MSTTIDSRVVEMKFDNKNFEKNVSTTMSTLDKLKQKLNLTGASKGLENVSATAKKVDMKGLGDSVETVRSKFSALEVMGVTALANITNSAVNAGKRIVSALTIDPVKTGFSEYTTQLQAVQTIMGAVGHKGKTIDDVNAALDELNEYADKTIYNFTEMTRNIGLFTNAGVDLDKSVLAIKGFSNAAAMAGTDATKTAGAMYQLSQAMSSGRVLLQDWRSLEQANITGERFQETVKMVAKTHNINVDSMIEKEGSFRDTLSNGWLTADLMTEALEMYTMTTDGLTEAQIEANREMLKSRGYTDDQIDKIFELGTTATDAATKVRDLGQMFDVLKESAQSGWSKTWRLIFGDLYEAQAVFTPLTNFLTNIIDSVSNARNKLLEGALTLAKPFQALNERIESVTKVTEKVTEALKDYDDIVNRIIQGEFGFGQKRWDKLTEMGYDWAHAQNLVNERLGDSHRYQTDYTEAVEETNKAQSTTIEQLMKMSEAELKHLGFTEEEIEAFKELAKYAELTGIPIEELIKDMDQLSGRSLLINSFKNIGKGLVAVFQAIKTAWQSIFPPKTTEERSKALYNFIATLHKFTTQFVLTKEELEAQLSGKAALSTIGKLVKTFKGLFAIIDVITTVVGGGFKAAFTVVKTLLSYFNVDILTLTAEIGDLLVKFRDWVDEHNLLVKAIEWLAPYLEKVVKAISKFIKHIKESGYIEKFANWIKEAAKAVGDWFVQLKNSEKLQGFINYLKKSATAIKDWIKGMKDADSIPKYILSGLVNGLKAGASDVWNSIIEIGTKILEKIKNVLGIHSPSTKFFEIGNNIIQGLLNGLKNGASTVWNFIKGLGSNCVEVLKNIDWGTVFAGALMVGGISAFNKIAKALASFSQVFEGLGEMFEDFGKGVKRYLSSAAMLNIAIAIGILALSIAKLAEVDTPKLWMAIGAIAALGLILVGLLALTSLINKCDGLELKPKTILAVLAISAAVFILSAALLKFTKIEVADVGKVLGIFGTIIAGLIVFVLSVNNSTVTKLAGLILSVSVSLLLMVGVIKLVNDITPGEIFKGIVVIAILGTFFAALIAVSKFAGEHGAKAGKMIFKMSIALLIMVGVIKLINKLTDDEIFKGLIVIAALGVFFAAIVAVSKFAGEHASKAGSMLLKMSIALLIISASIIIISKLSPDGIKKGLITIGLLGVLFAVLIGISKFAGEHAAKAGTMLLMMSGALLILTGVIFIVSLMEPEGLYRGLAVVSVLMLLFTGLIAATKNAQKCVGALAVMTLTIVLLVASIALLSYMDGKSLATATACVSAILIALSLLVKSMSSLSGLDKLGKGFMKALVGMAAMLIVVGLVLAMMSALKVENAIPNAIALGVLMFVLTNSIGNLKASKIQKVSGSVIVALAAMAAILAIMGLVLAMMSALKVNPITVIPNAIALGILMTVLTNSIGNLKASKIKTVSGSVILALFAMAGVMAVLGLVLAMMTALKVENAIPNAIALSLLASVLTVLLIPLSVIGAMVTASGGAILLGVVALLAMAVPMIAFVGILALMQNIQNAEANVKLLITLMSSMTAMLVVLALIGPLAIIGVSAMTALTGLMVVIGALAVAVGALMTKFPNLQEFLNAGIPIMIQIADGIGKMLGAFIAGVSAAIISTIPLLGMALSLFMTNIQIFIAGAKQIDASVLAGVGILAGVILALTAGAFISGLLSLGGIGLIALGLELSAFMTALKPFIDGAKELDGGVMDGVTALAKAVLTLTAANLIEGITKFFGGGESSLSKFAEELPKLGTGLAGFRDAIGEFTDDQTATINCAAAAVERLATAAKTLPNTGGLLGDLVGNNDLGVFADQLPNVGRGIRALLTELGVFTPDEQSTIDCAASAVERLATAAKNIPNTGGLLGDLVGNNDMGAFADQFPKVGTGVRGLLTELGEFTPEEQDTIDCAAGAIETLAKAAKTIPNSGGLLADLVGDNDLGAFASKFGLVGTGIKDFVTNIGTFGDDQKIAVESGAEAIKTLAAAANEIPNSGGFWSKIVGDNDLSTFAGKFGDVGTGIKNFVTNLGTFSNTQIKTVSNGVAALKAIATLAGTNIQAATNNLPSFGDNLAGLATDITSFCTNMPAQTTVESAMNSMKHLLTTMSGFADVDSVAMSTLSKSLKDIAASGLKSFINGFTDGTAKSEVIKAGKAMISNLLEGLEAKGNESKITKVCKSMAIAGAESVKDQKSEFKSAGKNVVEGFANGISLNKYIATKAAAAMAAAAAQAAKDELDINSPSKVFRAIAYSIPEGFAMGIDKYSNLVKDSSITMGDTAISSVKDSIARIAEVIDSDIDSQPTIRPVLDLSDVRSNAGLIGGLLNTDTSVGVLANVGSISTMMNRRIQNGGNLDVIAAIDKLRKDIGNINNTTYSINGVTYDDGSNIADAVEAIVRAARVERRR